jgi:DNA invertase Pin-like site-specific DNA recombinase
MKDKCRKKRQAKGITIGTSNKIPIEILNQIKRFLNQGTPTSRIARNTGISKTTIERIKHGTHWQCREESNTGTFNGTYSKIPRRNET